jgi:prepilin-type N-terminal cleavage/methylation domain-containing protein
MVCHAPMSFEESQKRRLRSSGGFSLIEVAIALLIIGIMITPILYGYSLYIKQRQLTQTSAALGIANMALIRYVAKYGHYPYPADRNIPLGAAGFGQAATEPGGGWPTCPALPVVSGVVCETNTNAYGAGSVLIGDLPAATLGIPYRSVLDGQGLKLTYAITKSLAQPIPFNESAGAVEVWNSAGASLYAAGEGRSHFIVISHGEDRRGAFGLGGTQVAACGTAAADGTDFENCNNDARFRSNFDAAISDNRIDDAAGANNFDDSTVTANVVGTGIWAIVPSQPNIRTDLGGNVYVGPVSTCAAFANCLPLARVDVDGDVRADRIKSDRFCRNVLGTAGNSYSAHCVDTTTATHQDQWFSPDQLADATPVILSSTVSPAGNPWEQNVNPDDATSRNGHKGAGIRCVEDRGMKGIVNFDERCQNTAYFDASVNIGSCPAGTYATQVNAAGQLTNCVAP